MLSLAMVEVHFCQEEFTRQRAKAREAVLGTCDHGTPKGYPCGDCDMDERSGGAT